MDQVILKSRPSGEMPASFRAQLDAALSRPVLLAPESVESVRAAYGFRVQMDEEDFDHAPKRPPYEMMDGVAVVRVDGPLAQRAWSCWIFEGDGYDAITARTEAALQDDSVSAVLLRIDSPGGEVAGCFEAVRSIRATARAVNKPIVAYADELAASAGYALATAADRIVLPDTGAVGSVGVIVTVIDQSKALEERGVRVHVISSGTRKADGHPGIPLSKEARAAVQGQIDYLANVFAAEVAQARGMTVEAVLGLEAGLFLGTRAVGAGLADQIGNDRDAISLAREMGRRTRPASATARVQTHGVMKMNKILAELGIAESEGAEDEAVQMVRSLKARAVNHDQVLALVGLTGCDDGEQVMAVVNGYKTAAERVPSLESEVKKLTENAEAAQRESLISQIMIAKKATPHQRDHYLSTLSIKDLRMFLQTAPTIGPLNGKIEPPDPSTKTKEQMAAEQWQTIPPKEKARLYQEDRAAYDALKKAAGE